jgi:hypothetical protein
MTGYLNENVSNLGVRVRPASAHRGSGVMQAYAEIAQLSLTP